MNNTDRQNIEFQLRMQFSNRRYAFIEFINMGAFYGKKCKDGSPLAIFYILSDNAFYFLKKDGPIKLSEWGISILSYKLRIAMKEVVVKKERMMTPDF